MLYLILQWYILVPALLALLYWHGTKNFSHWRKHGVKHIPPVFFFGNIRKRVLFQQSFHEIQKELYFAFPGEKIAGIYEGRRPTLMVRDPELIRLIMVRDFDHFVDRPFLRFPQRPSIANMLISLQGAHWKSVRATLTPTFTSGKIKAMSLLVTDVGKQMVSYLEKTIDKPDGCDMEMKDFFGRFTMDVIASCAFGVQCDSLTTPDAEFAAFAGKFNDVPIYERIMIFSILLFAPNLARFFPLSFLNRDVAKFLESVVRDTKAQRIKNGIRRNDFLQLMIDTADADKADGKKTVLTEDIVIAQSILFLLAGFETSSTVLAFTAYELALNPDIQSKLRGEIFKVLEKHQGKCTYEAVQEMEYLDMVIHESMRKHPPVARMDRQCTAAYTVPDTNLKLEPGTSVTIPVMGLHYDPEYYPDPDKFDPLRFSSEEKARRSPYVYLPFGAGPRNCIGARFALTSTKMAMAYLLQDFKVEPCGKTEVPYTYSKFSMMLKAHKGVWLNLKRLVEVSSPS